jgi:hypothetical protein
MQEYIILCILRNYLKKSSACHDIEIKVKTLRLRSSVDVRQEAENNKNRVEAWTLEFIVNHFRQEL